MPLNKKSARRAYYSRPVLAFLADDESHILGQLAKGHSFTTLEVKQRNAWLGQIRILKDQLTQFPSGHIFLEFSIPRMGKRADVVLFLHGTVFVIEFKVGSSSFDRAAKDQAIDYAQDLKDFHETSHHRVVVPILVATDAEIAPSDNDVDEHCFCTSRNGLRILLQNIIKNLTSMQDPDLAEEWANGRFKPTPTIVQAAQALYQGHRVEEISRYDVADLANTAYCVDKIIRESRSSSSKAICFITGVPGAGKTLAGLNLACLRQGFSREEHAVFLSGNGPLVDVLREALARDDHKRSGGTLKSAQAKVKAFIQNIHHFRDDNLESDTPPIEKVVIFDEAQRAWDQNKLAKHLKERKNWVDFAQSEPELLIDVMNRSPDWCVIVCLVGGGQEINSGEAGLGTWLAALAEHFRHWKIYCSSHIDSPIYDGRHNLERLTDLMIDKRNELHLMVPRRSFRTEKVHEFVHYLLNGSAARAEEAYRILAPHFPLHFTRDLMEARKWLRTRAIGTQRKGILASSGGRRLKAEGLHVRAEINPIDYFLGDKNDVRSCHSLEDVATEFDVQGLELDWTAVAWDLDLRRSEGNWCHHQFKGPRWTEIKDVRNQRYRTNSYRVLLSRARQGMVIYVPKGDSTDSTRPPEAYDHIAEYLIECGVQKLRPL